MCAINGISWEDVNTVKRMNRANKRRGPDYSGVRKNRVTFGHNLLAINGDQFSSRQPKVTLQKNILSYNGQLYDVQADQELDTNVVLNDLNEHGWESLKDKNGCWGIAWYNQSEDNIYLIRDHFGVKTVFYAECEKGLVFSSTVWGIVSSKQIDPVFDEDLLDQMQGGSPHISGRDTIYKNIKKLAPGEVLVYNVKTKKKEFRSLWEGFSFKPVEFKKQQFRDRIKDAVFNTARTKQRLAVLLSGGLDSNIIASLLGSEKLENFFCITMKYNREPEGITKQYVDKRLFQEERIASETTSAYGIEHYIEYFVGDNPMITKYAKECVRVAGSVFEDSFRMIPRYFLLTKTKQRGAKVVLSGEGGDELFSGYNTHRDWLDGIRTPKKGQTKKMILSDKKLKEWFPVWVLGEDETNNALFFHLMTITETHLLRLDSFSGHFSLESRVPFLYQDFAKYCFCIDSKVKLRYQQKDFRGINKYLLRVVMGDYLVDTIVNRNQKVGWSLPQMRHIDFVRKQLKIDAKNLKQSVEEVKKGD